jgi:hypothetical protein
MSALARTLLEHFSSGTGFRNKLSCHGKSIQLVGLQRNLLSEHYVPGDQSSIGYKAPAGSRYARVIEFQYV